MKPLRYIPWLLTAMAFFTGYQGAHVALLLPLAGLSTAIVAGDRIKQVRNTPQRVGKPNMLVEGAYLFVVQLIIFGLAWGLGFFLAFRVTT